MVSRAERSALANWWWTIDRWILAAVGALIVSGLVLTMAASPPVAERLGLSPFHFVHRQVVFLIPAVAVFVATSFLSPRQVRRVALFVFLLAMALTVAALLYGHEIKGSRRWIFGVQPSEFLKPAFVVLVAWAFSEAGRRRDVPANLVAVLLLLVTIVPLILQPDFGQTMLVALVWAALFVIAGLPWFWVAGVGGAGLGGALL
ncbi:MAG: FtsW/RodA/SpoVE family cell cycle protein, partial [Methylocella sp.]